MVFFRFSSSSSVRLIPPTMYREGKPSSSLASSFLFISLIPGHLLNRSYPKVARVESPPLGSRARTNRRHESRMPAAKVVLPAPVGATMETCSPGFQFSWNHGKNSVSQSRDKTSWVIRRLVRFRLVRFRLVRFRLVLLVEIVRRSLRERRELLLLNLDRPYLQSRVELR